MTRRILKHKCTLITYVDAGTTNDEGKKNYNEVTTNNVPCLFLEQEESNESSSGISLEHIPTLYLLGTQSVVEGSLVRDVLDIGNNVILRRAKIQTVNSTTEAGTSAMKMCTLEGASV